MLERVLQIAKACAEEMSANYVFSRNGLPSGQVLMQAKDFLENIIYYRVCSYTEQIALINSLGKIVSEHREVGTCSLLLSEFFLL